MVYSPPEDSLLTAITQEIWFSSLHLNVCLFYTTDFPEVLPINVQAWKSWLQTCAMSILEICILWAPQITGF